MAESRRAPAGAASVGTPWRRPATPLPAALAALLALLSLLAPAFAGAPTAFSALLAHRAPVAWSFGEAASGRDAAPRSGAAEVPPGADPGNDEPTPEPPPPGDPGSQASAPEQTATGDPVEEAHADRESSLLPAEARRGRRRAAQRGIRPRARERCPPHADLPPATPPPRRAP